MEEIVAAICRRSRWGLWDINLTMNGSKGTYSSYIFSSVRDVRGITLNSQFLPPVPMEEERGESGGISLVEMYIIRSAEHGVITILVVCASATGKSYLRQQN